MSILSAMRSLISREKKDNPTLQVLSSIYMLDHPVAMATNPDAWIKEGYRRNPTIYKCVSLLAQSGAGITWKVYADETKERELTSSPLLDLLRNPNPNQTFADIIEQYISYLLLTGNTYMYAMRKLPTQQPQELWVLRPDYMRIEPQAGGKLLYQYGADRDGTVYTDAQVAHVKYFSGNDDIYGLSPIEVASCLVDIQNGGLKWNISLMQNMARQSGFWTTTALLTKNDREALERKLQQKFAGIQNAGRTPILDGGLTWQSNSLTPQETDWNSTDERTTRSIAAIFTVAPEMIGDAAGKTFANMQEARQSLYTEALFPTLDRVQATLNKFLSPSYGGQYIAYDKDDIEALAPIRQATQKTIEDRATSLWNTGQITLNESRAMQGLAPLDGGDILRIVNTLIPVESLADYAEQSLTKPAMPNPPIADDVLNAPAAQPVAALPAKARRATKALDITTTEQKQAYWTSFEASREQWYTQNEAALKQYFAQEHKAVQHAVQSGAVDYSTIVTGLAPILGTVLTKLYTSVIQDFGAQTVQELQTGSASQQKDGLGDDFELSPDIKQWIRDITGMKITQIDGTTLDSLKALFEQGLAEGLSVDDLAGQIDQLYLEQIIPNRSVTIARTETISASNYGSLAGAQSSGLSLEKVWLATQDNRTRHDHALADGQAVAIDDLFSVGGGSLAYPGDPNGDSAQVVNCRCTVTYQRADVAAEKQRRRKEYREFRRSVA